MKSIVVPVFYLNKNTMAAFNDILELNSSRYTVATIFETLVWWYMPEDL